MKTKKITLNELKSIIKKTINEEILNENSSEMQGFIEDTFKDPEMFIEFYEILQHKLDSISDEEIKDRIRVLEHWNEEGKDFSKMDKLTILYWSNRLG